jgi:hypothetical protein
MKKIILFLTAFIPCIGLQAQNATVDTRAADFLRQSDSLYVVISILVTIFAGIILFLIFQERKISKLEKQLKDKTQ